MEDTSIEGGQDTLVWTITKLGDFELKETYEEIRNKKTQVSWHKLAWQVYVQQVYAWHHSFILWMWLRGALKTLKKLEQWGVVQSNVCALCWSGIEMEEHLFHSCSFAKTV